MLSDLPEAQGLCRNFKAIAFIGTPHQQLDVSLLKRLVGNPSIPANSSDNVNWDQCFHTVEDINTKFEVAHFPLRNIAFYEKEQSSMVHNFPVSAKWLDCG
jgi:hypothetical protein